MLAYSEEGVHVEEGTLWYQINKTLSENQQTMGFNFTDIRCGREKECEVLAHHTWMDRAINSKYVYLVKGDDKGRQAWYYVLVDKKKENQFKVQLAAETMDLEKYGQVLCSGYGKDPPEEKKKRINQFTDYQKRITCKHEQWLYYYDQDSVFASISSSDVFAFRLFCVFPCFHVWLSKNRLWDDLW